MRVQRNIGRATVLVKADHRDDTFIEATASSKRAGWSYIHLVRSGELVRREHVTDLRAPARVIEIAKGERL